MKYVAVSGIADKEGVLIPMGETFDDARLDKEVKARFLKLGAIKKPEQVEAEIEAETNNTEEVTRESLMKKDPEELIDIARGLNLKVPEKPTKTQLTKLILGEDAEEK